MGRRASGRLATQLSTGTRSGAEGLATPRPGTQSAACGKAAVLPAAVLARLGLPALAALVLLCVLLLAVICWIISNGDRSDRLNRMMLALQGKASCLAPRPCTASELAAGAVTCGLAG